MSVFPMDPWLLLASAYTTLEKLANGEMSLSERATFSKPSFGMLSSRFSFMRGRCRFAIRNCKENSFVPHPLNLLNCQVFRTREGLFFLNMKLTLRTIQQKSFQIEIEPSALVQQLVLIGRFQRWRAWFISLRDLRLISRNWFSVVTSSNNEFR